MYLTGLNAKLLAAKNQEQGSKKTAGRSDSRKKRRKEEGGEEEALASEAVADGACSDSEPPAGSTVQPAAPQHVLKLHTQVSKNCCFDSTCLASDISSAHTACPPAVLRCCSCYVAFHSQHCKNWQSQ